MGLAPLDLTVASAGAAVAAIARAISAGLAGTQVTVTSLSVTSALSLGGVSPVQQLSDQARTALGGALAAALGVSPDGASALTFLAADASVPVSRRAVMRRSLQEQQGSTVAGGALQVPFQVACGAGDAALAVAASLAVAIASLASGQQSAAATALSAALAAQGVAVSSLAASAPQASISMVGSASATLGSGLERTLAQQLTAAATAQGVADALSALGVNPAYFTIAGGAVRLRLPPSPPPPPSLPPPPRPPRPPPRPPAAPVPALALTGCQLNPCWAGNPDAGVPPVQCSQPNPVQAAQGESAVAAQVRV